MINVMTLTDSQAQDILTGAAEGGFGSEWFKYTDILRDPITHAIVRCVVVHDYDEPSERHAVTAETIRKGWALMLEQYGYSMSYLGEQVREAVQDMLSGPEHGTPGVMDAIGTDACVQLAVLGEVVYG